MTFLSIYPLPGLYQYVYPTFADIPQQICIHFLTPDRQKAYVSYPHHRSHKAAQLIDVSWFDSVELVKLDGQPQLMHFLDVILPKWLNNSGPKLVTEDLLIDCIDEYTLRPLLYA